MHKINVTLNFALYNKAKGKKTCIKMYSWIVLKQYIKGYDDVTEFSYLNLQLIQIKK